MKCTHCGLPLSPTNTSKNCPRCHNYLVPAPDTVAQQSQEQGGNQAWSGSEQGPSWAQAQQWQSPPTPSSPQWTTGSGQNQIPFPPTAQPPLLQAEYVRQSVPAPTPGVMYSTPAPGMRPQTPRMSNRGFIIAALCVISGGLILVFVYFTAMGLPAAPITGANTLTPVATKNIVTTTPTTPLLSPTTVPSPTAGALPGQSYIDSPQMASAVNTTTAQPLQLTTTFKINQKIYITFNIHPNGKNGAVCLIWYLNNKSITQFPFGVTASAKAGYSYAIYGGTGPAYVEIYWASTMSCSDKILAQHVTFSVTH
jgi:hypothetical protein